MIFKDTQAKKAFLLICNIFAGFITVLGFAPYNHWFFPLLGLVIFFAYVSNQDTAKKTAFSVFTFCFTFNLGTLWWINKILNGFGEMPFILSFMVVSLLSAYLSLFPALAGYLSHKFYPQKTIIKNIIALPILWIYADYINAWMFTGFSWTNLGYTQIESPLGNYAPLLGCDGITYIMLITCSSISYSIFRKNFLALIMPSVLLLGSYFLGNIQFVNQLNPIKVALLQGNIDTELKWSPDMINPTLKTYYSLITDNLDSHIILMPESAIPALENLLERKQVISKMDEFAKSNNIGLITGFQYHNEKDNKYYNGIIGLGVVDKAKTVMYKFGESNRYYKRHLVPIGEYLPLGDLVRSIGPIFNMPMNYFSHGAEKQPNIQSQGLNIASAICYEIIFNSELSTQINENTNIIATISNDGWFNGTNGPHQHLSIARMRAKEFGKPVMRATNNGITAVIDYNGNIISELPQNVTSSLKTVLRPTKGITPFCVYGKTPMIILCTLLLIYTFYTNRKLKKQNKLS
ncbi:MAG: apolipoprotein N-acyltransferase [Ruminobacter sp.]|nr:apolipoprotein N-acyltransferase [Ruminobacter sp.]